MKIAYWSPIHGQAGTTSNILSTALISSLYFKRKCLLTQTHFIYNNLEAPLVGSNSKNISSSDFFRDVGIDSLIRCFKAAKLTEDMLENCCITLPNTTLKLLPGTSKRNRDSFEYEMTSVIINLLRTVEKMTDLVFIDVSSGNNPLSYSIMKDCDLTVINLSQNIELIDSYFTEYQDNMPNKIFYLFGSYDRDSKYNIHNLRRRYWRSITSHNSGVIPYNTSFMDASCDGRLAEFIQDNLLCDAKDWNKYFIQRALRSTEKILKIAGTHQIREERT